MSPFPSRRRRTTDRQPPAPMAGREVQMETVVLIAVAVAAAVGGAVLGMIARGMFASNSMKAAQSEARRMGREPRARQKELILEAKDEKLKMQREAEDE